MANPAAAELQLLGVYDEKLVEPLARSLAKLGVRRAMVVHGDDGLDEISLAAPTRTCEVRDGQLFPGTLDPRQLGFALCEPSALVGGDAAANAAIAQSILGGETGPRRDVVLLNAGACLYLAGRAANLAEGVALAAATLDSGAAMAAMRRFVVATREVA
jgi:anthranilate phosphoribosyltransferase